MSAFAKQEPNIAPGVFVADSADVVGAVEIGAGALVTGGTVVPEGSLVLGAPAKTSKPLKDNMRDMAAHSAREYADLGQAYRAGEFRRYSPESEE